MITVRIWFEKRNEASYISLLDLQRVMQRVLKRSGLPVWHTLGFNPHIYMTFTCPLSLGQESLCESVDVKTEAEAPDFAAWQASLNAIMPAGIRVFRVEPARDKASAIAFACYTIRYPAAAAGCLAGYNALDAAPVEKKGKKGSKQVDLKAYIPALDGRAEGDSVCFDVCLPAAQELNLNPSLLTGFLEERFGAPAAEAAILRTALRVAKAPRSRGNPFLPAYAGQKFLPPGIPLGTKFGAEPRTRPYGLAHSQRQISL